MARRLVAVAVSLTAVVFGLAAQPLAASAAGGGITVKTYFSGGQTVHPGDVIFVDVSVSTFDQGTTAPVRMKLWTTRGTVIGFADLGYPVHCWVRKAGGGRCVTDNPMGAGHGIELSVEVQVGPHAAQGDPSTRQTSLTVFARSKPDHMWGNDTVDIPVAPAS
ncbi:MAG: hypothetical protein JO222_00315 [Frankiales bacterium]|nr:hypothetical protein [Frankiales bacterium]